MSIRILHLTHIDNLQRLLSAGGLWSSNHMPASLQPSSIAHSSIQSRRARRVVPVGPGGVLHDYVPFYFGARSPMLYANHGGHVLSNPHGQAPLIYLVSRAQDVAAAGLGFVFTDGHAVMAYTNFYGHLDRLSQLDWSAVRSRWWEDTPDHPDRKRKKQAEFLVHQFFPMSLMRGIVVYDDLRLHQVRQILSSVGHNLPVTKHAAWYY